MAYLNKFVPYSDNTRALVVDKALLDLLGIDTDAPVKLSSPDGRSLLITPLGPGDLGAPDHKARKIEDRVIVCNDDETQSDTDVSLNALK